MQGAKKFSPVIFVFVLICFFLPFVNFSCGGQKIASFTGIQLVIGVKVNQPPSMFGESTGMPGSFGMETSKPKASKQGDKAQDSLIIAAFIIAIAGFALSFLKGKNNSIVPAILGVVGIIILLIFKTKTDNEILREGGGAIQVEYVIGFWLTFLAFVLAALFNSFIFFGKEKPVETTRDE
jgi:hypothetical protein